MVGPGPHPKRLLFLIKRRNLGGLLLVGADSYLRQEDGGRKEDKNAAGIDQL